eukprot:SAG11_NODE_3846_length_2193_cov_1.155205_1_plen_97_part_10
MCLGYSVTFTVAGVYNLWLSIANGDLLDPDRGLVKWPITVNPEALDMALSSEPGPQFAPELNQAHAAELYPRTPFTCADSACVHTCRTEGGMPQVVV